MMMYDGDDGSDDDSVLVINVIVVIGTIWPLTSEPLALFSKQSLEQHPELKPIHCH